ncbi:MAG: sulfur carrier protein ThiS [Candidatus Eiseniibacteriota bacterium]
MAEIRLNGRVREVPDGETLAGLVGSLGLDPRWVVAELNGRPVPRQDFAGQGLSGGDRLELVRPVAGG